MKRLLAFAMAPCVGLALLAGGPARADTTFNFYGSGWGHGIGMSQYGALGLAQNGWSSAEIIQHYYRGSNVVQRDPPRDSFRIGLLQYRRVVTLTARSGSFVLKLSSGKVIGRVREGQSRTVVIRNGRYRIRRPSGGLVGGHAWGSDSVHLQADPEAGSVVGVAEWGHSVMRGFLAFAIVGDASAHLVVVIRSEPYLFGIGEVPSSWPDATLRAQAMAARTYAYRVVANLEANPDAFRRKWAACRCHLYGTPADQNYTGWDKEAESSGGRWVAAVRDTSKQVAVHDGGLITTYYSSSSGGHTENVENVWLYASPQPYLKGVCDPREDETSNPYEFWSTSRSGSWIASALRPYSDVNGNRIGNIGTLRRFKDFVRGISGRVARVTLVGSDRSVVVAGWTLRSALGLRDTRFSVNSNLNIGGRIRNRYDAEGCKPGRAESPRRSVEGGAFQNFKVGRIYVHSGRSRAIWLRRAIFAKYQEERAHRGFLGLPYRWASIDGGARAWFDGGQILSSAATGAHEIHGPVLDKYIEAGDFSTLGYPLTDVREPDSLTRTAEFQGGSIVCTRPDTDSAWSCSLS